jgi:hypothetical protein
MLSTVRFLVKIIGEDWTRGVQARGKDTSVLCCEKMLHPEVLGLARRAEDLCHKIAVIYLVLLRYAFHLQARVALLTQAVDCLSPRFARACAVRVGQLDNFPDHQQVAVAAWDSSHLSQPQ